MWNWANFGRLPAKLWPSVPRNLVKLGPRSAKFERARTKVGLFPQEFGQILAMSIGVGQTLGNSGLHSEHLTRASFRSAYRAK